MASENETIKDALKVLRVYPKAEASDGSGLVVLNNMAIADRIEATTKRECEATSEKSSQVCNAAAMLDALYAITRIDTRMLKRLLCELVEADIFDGGQIRDTIHAVEKARQAIAAPPRNCDAFSKDKVLEMLKDRSFSKEDTIEWLFAEAKGEAK